MNTARLESLLWAGAAIGILYFLYRGQRKIEEGLQFAAEAYGTARNSTANLIETFFPLVNPNSMITYAVTFPDGSRHAVLGESVDSNGFFEYRGARFRLMVNSSGAKIAVSA